jgi:hypothetical protein
MDRDNDIVESELVRLIKFLDAADPETPPDQRRFHFRHDELGAMGQPRPGRTGDRVREPQTCRRPRTAARKSSSWILSRPMSHPADYPTRRSVPHGQTK